MRNGPLGGTQLGVKVCTIEGCHKAFYARDWCKIHYSRWWVHGDPTAVKKLGRPRVYDPVCSLEGCERPSRTRGMCHNHYQRFWAGTPAGRNTWAAIERRKRDSRREKRAAEVDRYLQELAAYEEWAGCVPVYFD